MSKAVRTSPIAELQFRLIAASLQCLDYVID